MVSEGQLSRRQLLGATGAAAALAGCAATQSASPSLSKIAIRASRADLPMLESVLKLEYLAAYAYTAAIPLLSGQSLVAARQFLHHELAHITVLHSLIESAHSKPSAQQSSYPLGHPEGTRELLGLLHRIEAQLLGAYLHAIPRLSAGGVRSVAAAIMANEGQHIAMLRGRLDLDPVPAALPTASE